MFWKRKEPEGEDKKKLKEEAAAKKKHDAELVERGFRQQIVGSALWVYLRDQHGLGGEALGVLKKAETADVVESKPVKKVRVFDPGAAEEKVGDTPSYEDFDKHPELILYEGWYCEKGGRVTEGHLKKKHEYVPKTAKK